MRLSSHSSEPDAPDSAQASWRVRDLMALMESWYPQATAQSWDRVGLIVGDPDAPVRSLLLALDPTAAIAEQAVAAGYQDSMRPMTSPTLHGCSSGGAAEHARARGEESVMRQA